MKCAIYPNDLYRIVGRQAETIHMQIAPNESQGRGQFD